MPRSGGVYTKPVGTTAVSGTVIQSSKYNELADDIGAEITASLPRDGSVGMTITGSAGSPAVAIDGAGGGTGLFGTNTGTADYIAFSVDGIEVARFEDATGLELGYASVWRNGTAGHIEIAGGSGLGLGGNVRVYGESHATRAGDVEFRSGTSTKLHWDQNQGHWDLNGTDIIGISSLVRGVDNDLVQIGGGSTAAMGGNIVFYGDSHGSKPSWFEIREDGIAVYTWNATSGEHQFADNDLTEVNQITFTGGDTITGLPTWTEYDLGAYATSTVYTQAHGLGADPEDFRIYLECTTPDNNYAIGDRILVNAYSTGTTAAIGAQFDGLNIRIVTTSALIAYPPKTGGNAVTLGTGDWKVILRVRD